MTRISKYLLTRVRCFRTKSDRNPWCAQIAPWWFWQTKDQDRRKIQASHPRRRPRYPRRKWNFFRAEKSWLMALYIISYQHPFVTQKIYCTANIQKYTVGWGNLEQSFRYHEQNLPRVDQQTSRIPKIYCLKSYQIGCEMAVLASIADSANFWQMGQTAAVPSTTLPYPIC